MVVAATTTIIMTIVKNTYYFIYKNKSFVTGSPVEYCVTWMNNDLYTISLLFVWPAVGQV